MTPGYLKPAAAARYLGIARATFYRHVVPTITRYRLGGNVVVYAVADLDRWAQARREAVA